MHGDDAGPTAARICLGKMPGETAVGGLDVRYAMLVISMLGGGRSR